jgi:hypothetical protein
MVMLPAAAIRLQRTETTGHYQHFSGRKKHNLHVAHPAVIGKLFAEAAHRLLFDSQIMSVA